MSQLREARLNALTSRAQATESGSSSAKPAPRILAPASPPRLPPASLAQPKKAPSSTAPVLPPAPRVTSGPSFAERSAALLRKAEEAANRTPIPARNTAGFSQPASTTAAATSSRTGAGTSYAPRSTAAKHKERWDPLAALEDELEESDRAEQTLAAAGAGKQRDERMRLIEELQPGPAEVPDNFDDPHWMKHEPFSGTRLR